MPRTDRHSRKVSRMTNRKDILDGPSLAELADAWKYVGRRGFTVHFHTGHITGPLDWNSDPGTTEVVVLGLRHIPEEEDTIWFEARIIDGGTLVQGRYKPGRRKGYFE